MLHIRQFILDWSGTLVDDLAPVWKTTNHVLAECGLPAITLDQFRREFCLPVHRYYARFLPDMPMPQLEALFMAKYPEHRDDICLLPHTVGFLEFCAANGIDCYIASSVDPDTYDRQMRRFNLHRFIRKPYIAIVDKAVTIHDILAENNLSPDETMFVGDMEHDIEAGKAGGIHTCAVLSGYNHAEALRAMEPDFLCAHIGELQQLLAGEEIAHG
jgi:phosphoglycolate phosphatase